METLKEFDKIKKLEPFTKILFVDNEKCTSEVMLFIYADASTWGHGTFYACNVDKCGAPREYRFGFVNNLVYINWTYEEQKKIEDGLKEKSILRRKLKKIKDEHWGYVKGELTCFWVNTAAWKLEDINMRNVNYTVDDIESVCINKPNFEDVKKILPKRDKKIIDRCHTEKWKGKNLNAIKETNDEFIWYYKTIQYIPDKTYTVYYYCTDDAEGYCYTHYVYIED